jgi:hypothetical protein
MVTLGLNKPEGNLEKMLDKPQNPWYNKDTKGEGEATRKTG